MVVIELVIISHRDSALVRYQVTAILQSSASQINLVACIFLRRRRAGRDSRGRADRRRSNCSIADSLIRQRGQVLPGAATSIAFKAPLPMKCKTFSTAMP
jgi:hypothetical protein